MQYEKEWLILFERLVVAVEAFAVTKAVNGKCDYCERNPVFLNNTVCPECQYGGVENVKKNG